MGEIVPFKKPTAAEKYKNRTLCKSGFHKWRLIGDTRFDVIQGKLVTVFRCERCGASKHELR